MKIIQTDIFITWLKKLKDSTARARINLRIRRIELTGNLGEYRSLGDDLFELKIDYGPGYRVYFSQFDDAVLLLLVGGDKSSQQRDIKKARKALLQAGREWDKES